MEVRKTFAFQGVFKKDSEPDDNPILDCNATIYCYVNGLVFFVPDVKTSSQIAQKVLKESSDYEYYDRNFVSHNNYGGDCLIEGQTPEGWTIFGIASTPFSIFQPRDFEINISNLKIDYNPEIKQGKVKKVIFGVVDFTERNFSVSVFDSKAIFQNKSIREYVSNRKSTDVSLSSELTLIANEEIDIKKHEKSYYWLQALLIFASGNAIKTIYKIQVFEEESRKKEVEFWKGSKEQSKAKSNIQITQYIG